jgi:hypothetical protein
MPKINHLLMLALPLALAACGGGDHWYPGYAPLVPAGPYANLQVVNTSPTAPPIDVLLDGAPFATHLDYGQGTGEQPVTPGTHTVLVQIETPGTPTTVVGPTTLDVAANTDYVLDVNGMAGASPSNPLALATFPHPLAVVPSQSARVQVLNAFPTSAVIYLTAPGASLASSTALGTAPAGGAVGPVEVAAGAWDLWVTFPGCTIPPTPTPIVLGGGTDQVLSVLVPVEPPSNATAEPCGSFTLAAVDSFGNNTLPNAVATLRVIQDSPNASALALTVNGDVAPPFVSSLAYAASTGYQSLGDPGVYGLALAPAGNPSGVLASQSVAFGAGSYSLYATGLVANLFPFITRDDYRPYATQARFRFIQGSPSASAVDVYLTAPGIALSSTTPTYPALPFPSDTGFVSYAQGTYDLTVTLAGSTTPIIGPVSLSLSNGGVYTAVARDAAGGGAPYGLIALDDLGAVP